MSEEMDVVSVRMRSEGKACNVEVACEIEGYPGISFKAAPSGLTRLGGGLSAAALVSEATAVFHKPPAN